MKKRGQVPLRRGDPRDRPLLIFINIIAGKYKKGEYQIRPYVLNSNLFVPVSVPDFDFKGTGMHHAFILL